jgi:hypothetical protein
MSHIAVVTHSFLPDLSRCELLAESLSRFASAEHRHVVLVPRSDLAIFQDRLGPFGTAVVPQEELLPSWLHPLPFGRKWQLSTRGLPVRGWIRQQVVKIGFACLSTADAVVFADSDTCVVRPFDTSLTLRPGGRVRLLADPDDGDTEVHRDWYRRAGRLLGIPVKDYYGFGFIANLLPWVPDHARAMVRRIEEQQGRDWRSVLLHQRTFSEYVLYGVFVQQVLGFDSSRHAPESRKPVLENWATNEIPDETLLQFVETLPDDQVAIHVQSKARYSFDVYASAIRALWSGDRNAVRSPRLDPVDGHPP